MKKEISSRGFASIKFEDLYGTECRIAKSSLATDDAIWLGVANSSPVIMSSDALRLGLRERTFDERDNGWVEYPLPKEVVINTTMHLNRQQAKDLVKILRTFIKTGDL